ncbi:MAG: hypothetical protein NWE92_04985 [Candidatus Bathyarchaeota archaeon]|nr:hypothetical protein [Candidatus Bathyarchaeota archaeon]
MQNKKSLTIMALTLICLTLVASLNTASAKNPKITLDKDSACIGDVITVTGVGFAHKSKLTIELFKFETTTDKSGQFKSEITIPDSGLTAGTYDVVAQDAEGNKDTVKFTILPKIQLSQNSGPQGTTITITGKGYSSTAADGLQATFNGKALALGHLEVDGKKGTFTATFNVPSISPGFGYPVAVSEKAHPTIIASATFTITPCMELPEYPLGALLAMVSCAAAFIIYRKRQQLHP